MISLCITTYNRFEMLMESFAQVLDDDRIGEIVIVDDHSDMVHYDQIAAATINMPKVKLYRNPANLGMGRNKARSLELAKNDWCILFDSDNVMSREYLNAIPGYSDIFIDTPSFKRDPKTIYCPDFAMPQFDYRAHAYDRITQSNVSGEIGHQAIELCLNTCNYLVNRHEYLKVYQYNPEMKGTDTIWFNYLWLKADNSFYIVPGMEYMHRVHAGSGFLQDCDYNMKKAKEIKELIKHLS